MNILEKIIEFLKKIFFIKDKEDYQIKTNNSYYEKKDYLLTQTELKFYRVLKEITDELNLTICPQVSLYEIVKTNNYKDFNRISRKTIDFVITENNLKIRCCIELDDYTHNRKKRIVRDNFIDKIFEQTGIKLLRVQVKHYYDKEQIKNAIMS